MAEMNRRNCIQGTIAALAGNAMDPAAASAQGTTTPFRKPRDPRRRGMRLAELFYPGEDHKIRLAGQIGITHAIVSTASTLSRVPRARYVEELRRIKADLSAT